MCDPQAIALHDKLNYTLDFIRALISLGTSNDHTDVKGTEVSLLLGMIEEQLRDVQTLLQ